MKNLNGKELMRGDLVLLAAPDGSVMGGQIHQFYDRNDTLRIAGYPFQVAAKDTVLAQDAFEAFAVPLLKERDEAERQKLLDAAKAEQDAKDKAKADADAKAKADAEAASKPAEPPKAPEPANKSTPPVSESPAGQV